MKKNDEDFIQFPNSFQNKTVVLGISGGIDSAVSAFLLKKYGYSVIGITLLLHNKINDGKRCCGIEDISDAKNVCSSIGIKHYVINESELFHENVIENTKSNFLYNKVIVPCSICNSKVRIPSLIRFADMIGADYISTGHYALILHGKNYSLIKRPIDSSKDQTHFLSYIPDEYIKRFITPIGNLKKKEVREIGKNNDILVFDKNDSQDLCFLKKNESIYDFVKKNTTIEKISGNFVLNGKNVGNFDDFYKYNIGQRKGLGISNPEALYVAEKDLKNKTITLKTEKYMFSEKIYLKNIYLRDQLPVKNKKKFKCDVVTRALKESINSEIELINDEKAIAYSLNENKRFRYVTEGQICVMYLDSFMIGSGEIFTPDNT